MENATKKTFPFKNCRSCARSYGVSERCNICNGESEYEELYNADPNCVHNVVPVSSGVKCTKCDGWFCY